MFSVCSDCNMTNIYYLYGKMICSTNSVINFCEGKAESYKFGIEHVKDHTFCVCLFADEFSFQSKF